MLIGAAWSLQLIAVLIAFGFGVAGGLPALLLKRKARFLERCLTDFAALAALTALYILSCEVGDVGQVHWYTLLFFIFGTLCSARVFALLKRAFLKLKRRKTA
jgi:hypothetical protein